jgi:hypothetical protein
LGEGERGGLEVVGVEGAGVVMGVWRARAW